MIASTCTPNCALPAAVASGGALAAAAAGVTTPAAVAEVQQLVSRSRGATASTVAEAWRKPANTELLHWSPAAEEEASGWEALAWRSGQEEWGQGWASGLLACHSKGDA